jgi:predicted  nucleic acid-binding Zn-ribbon protein
MSTSDIEGIKTKLFALNMRVAEVRNEVAAAQARVTRLEKQLEDARLAALLGEHAGDPAEISPQLETCKTELADHQQLLRTIRSLQWETRLRYLLARRQAMQAERKESAEEK